MDSKTIQWTIEHKKDLYGILGVSADADEVTIQRSYRRLMLLTHPDKVQGEAAHEACLAIMFAYQVLSDYNRRMLYDCGGHQAVSDGGSVSVVDSAFLLITLFPVFFRWRTGCSHRKKFFHATNGYPDDACNGGMMTFSVTAWRITFYIFLIWSVLLGFCGLASNDPPFSFFQKSR